MMTTLLSLFVTARHAFLHAVTWARLEYYKRCGLQIGENFTCVGVPHFNYPGLVRIGNNVSISGEVSFIAHDATPWHLRKIGYWRLSTRYAPITIHDDCGIGHGAMILPGVTIGPRSIVGAGAVVRRDVPPNTVVVGNPARVAMTIDEYISYLERSAPEYSPKGYKLQDAVEHLTHNGR